MPPPPSPRALLLNGTVGAGKTTTAHALGNLLRTAGVPHAVVDLDALRLAWPAPPGDPFHEDLMRRNLRAVAAHHLAAGATRLVLAGVLETHEGRRLLQEAVGVPLTVCRVRVDVERVRERLRHRERDPGDRTRHLHRAGELHAILEAAGVDDVVVDVADEPEPAAGWTVARTVARTVLARWDAGT